MKEPSLVIMAAGMGSRYGGLKQIDPVDSEGNKIIDFSIYDAIRAGFKKVIFVIKKENEKDFRTCIGDVIKDHIEVEYVFQDINDIPDGFPVPDGRTKPWGTAHAVLSCRNVVDGPFAVINADDFYGREAYEKIYDFLTKTDDRELKFAMVGFELQNTLTENGSVSRGICEKDNEGFLTDIAERTQIIRTESGAAYTEDNGKTYKDLKPDTLVSMNFWGFTKEFMHELEKAFNKFMETGLREDPMKAECYLPFVVDDLLKEGRATVRVLSSKDRWFGVTYKEDKPFVIDSLKRLKEKGEYPDRLW